MTNSNNILGIGSPIIDFLLQVDENFLIENVGDKGGMSVWDNTKQEETLALAKKSNIDITITAGGSASNSIKALGFLGSNVSFLGVHGDDEYAKIYLHELAKANVDTKYLFERSGVNTDRCISFITPDCERTFRSCHSASSLIGEAELEKVNFSEFKLIYIEGYQMYNLDFFLKVIDRAKASKSLICLDLSTYQIASSFRELIGELLKNRQIDMIFANLEEAEAYLSRYDMEPKEIIKELQKTCILSALKLGSHGAIVANKEDIVEVPACHVKVVDTTGAGDFWASGFLYSYFNGENLEKSAQYANYIAGKVIGHIGARLNKANFKI